MAGGEARGADLVGHVVGVAGDMGHGRVSFRRQPRPAAGAGEAGGRKDAPCGGGRCPTVGRWVSLSDKPAWRRVRRFRTNPRPGAGCRLSDKPPSRCRVSVFVQTSRRARRVGCGHIAVQPGRAAFGSTGRVRSVAPDRPRASPATGIRRVRGETAGIMGLIRGAAPARCRHTGSGGWWRSDGTASWVSHGKRKLSCFHRLEHASVSPWHCSAAARGDVGKPDARSALRHSHAATVGGPLGPVERLTHRDGVA